MNATGQQILQHLDAVAAERRSRAADPALARRVEQVKRYQHDRFALTYADILAQPRYAAAARFFLDDLYGPSDFTERDAQFARIVPALVRLFPRDIVDTVRDLSALHALSERLDTAMAAVAPAPGASARDYALAWQGVGRPEERERQIALMMNVGRRLDGFTRNPLLRHSLRLMRGPAAAAGLGALQGFLERGFDTFATMRGATDFLATIASRERALAALLFAAEPAALLAGAAPVLGQLP